MPVRKAQQRMTKKEFIKKVSQGTLSVDKVIGNIAEELQRYERKYGMRSEVFYALIPGTPTEDQPDFVNWAICYRSYFRALQSKFPIRDLSVFRGYGCFAKRDAQRIHFRIVTDFHPIPRQ